MTHPARRGRQLALAVGTAVCLLAGRAEAQVWGEIDLPGGVTAAREVLGLGTETCTASAFLLDFVRTFHQFGDVDSAAIERFERYLRYVQELRGVLALWPDGMELGKDRLAGQTRERWRTVAEHLGLRLREVKNRPVLEVDRDNGAAQRAVWLKALGVDVPKLAQQLNQGERVRLAIPSDALPLPLPGLWPTILDQPGKPDIVRLGATHRPALLYVGLMSLDGDTLAFWAANSKALDLDTPGAGVLAAFGRSIHVRGRTIVVPGGPAYAPVWVRLVDRRLDEPVEFIRRLLSKDDGRLAYLYDTVAHLAPVRQTALFDGAATTDARIEGLENHYRWFRDVEPAWKVGTRPFFRPGFDPSLALTLLDIAPDGQVGPTWWPKMLEKITDEDGWPARPLKDLDDRRAGLGWGLRWIFDSQAPGSRFRLLRYAQRQFARSPKAEAAGVEVALRGFSRMPALSLVMERMGVNDAAVLAEVAEAGMRLTLLGEIDRVEPALRQWQAALAIFEQIVRRRSLPADTRDGLLLSLSKLVPHDRAPAPGTVAEWVVEQLSPVLGVPAAGSNDYEAAAIKAWLAPEAQPTRTLSWEGLEYRIDRVGPVVRDATAVRAGVKGPTLTQLEVLVRTRREMVAGVKALDRAKDIAARLDSVRKELLELRDDKNEPRFETEDLEDAARTIAKIRRDKDLNRVSRQVEKLDYTFGVVTGYVLPALAYALAAAPTPQPQIYADIAERHVNTASPDLPPEEWRRSAWQLPKTGVLPTGSAGVLGALLALDTALSDGQLRRLAAAEAGAPQVEGKINPIDRDAVTMRLLYASPFADADVAGSVATSALAAGHERWSQSADRAASRADVEATLAPVLGETRANLVLWLRERELGERADELLLPTEQARLGLEPLQTLPVGLGVSGLAFDGCLCLRPPPLWWPVTDWSARGDSGHLSVLVADVELRVVQALHDLKLPLYLMELVLPMALQDTLDRVGQFSPADWEALAASRFIPNQRVEEYLLVLVAEGVLAPPIPAAVRD